MTSSACSVCGREVAVGFQHSIRIGSRWVQWRECVSCNAEQDRRAQEAIRNAERAGA